MLDLNTTNSEVLLDTLILLKAKPLFFYALVNFASVTSDYRKENI